MGREKVYPKGCVESVSASRYNRLLLFVNATDFVLSPVGIPRYLNGSILGWSIVFNNCIIAALMKKDDPVTLWGLGQTANL